MNIRQIIQIILMGTLMSFAITPFVKRFARIIGAVDIPDGIRHVHATPTPRLGGLSIYFGFLVTLLLFSDVTVQLSCILIGATIIVVLGCVDDVIRLSYWIKLIFQFIAALIVSLSGLTIDTIANPLSSFGIGGDFINMGVFAIPVTIIWIIAITNSVNFIDGLDGLACGVSAIGSLSLLFIAIILNESEVILIIAALLGGCVGFLPFNINPAKLFMGDTGATFLGFILGVISVAGVFKLYTVVSFVVPFILLGLPIFDIVVSVFRRLFSGKNPAHADRGHIHHRLIDRGLTQKQAVAVLYMVSALLGLSAVALTALGTVRVLLLLLAIPVALVVTFVFLFPKKKQKTTETEVKDEQD